MPHNTSYVDIVMSGFGGQGILLSGNLMCYAAINGGKEVTFFPSYGAEMRGGAANCYVTISDRPIGSPIPSSPAVGMIMSQPALERFQSVIKTGGHIYVNTDIIKEELVVRDDLKKMFIPANRISIDVAGSERLANMVMVGALVADTGVLPVDAVMKALGDVVSSRHKALIPLNEKAIAAGVEYARGNRAS